MKRQTSMCAPLRVVPWLLVGALLLAGCGVLSPAPPTATPEPRASDDAAPTEAAEVTAEAEEEAAAAESPAQASATSAVPTESDSAAEPDSPAEATVPPATPGLPPGPGGNLIMPLGAQDPPSLDPALIGDTTSAFVARQLFSGLLRLDNELNVQPDLAERWEVSDDGRTYTFSLRATASFADGSPLTSADVQYSLERATDPNLAPYLPAQTYLSDIEGVREKLAGQADSISGLQVIDERTLSLTIDRPKNYFLSKLAHPTSFIVDQQAVERGGETWTENPNGSGPFALERWDRNQIIILQRNVNFYRELARLDRVTFLLGAAANNPLVLYEEGEIDITGVSSFALDRIRDESNPLSQELRRVPQLSLSYIGMNVNEPPFDDPAVRQAFALMLDRDKIAEISLNGSAVPAWGILPPGMPGYNPDLPTIEPDPERVRGLLAESRYGSGENLPPIVAYGGGWTATLREVAADEYGIEIEVRAYENFGAYLSALDSEDLPMFGLAWIADYPDPENFLDLLFRGGSGENYTDYANPRVDALLDEAAAESDEERRWELYQEAELLIVQDAPIIPITHDVEYTLVKPYVRGLEITPLGILDLSTVELVRAE